MNKLPEILMDVFRYHLPPERIAQHPLPQRDASKLLVYQEGNCHQDRFWEISNYLSDSDLLVFNNTKVIQARLVFEKPTGASLEIFLLEPIAPSADFAVALEQSQSVTWRCLLGNARKWNDPFYTILIEVNGRKIVLTASGKKPLKEGTFSIQFSWDQPEFTFRQLLEARGDTPLPPYIKRKAIAEDRIRYQTVMARHDGSVAAPTAGLHFSKQVLDTLSAKRIQTEAVTLHVGLGTFRPIATPLASGHVMHQETFSVSLHTLKVLKAHLPGKVVAVGTTAVRTLESIYWLGIRLLNSGVVPTIPLEQWFPYQGDDSGAIQTNKAIQALIDFLQNNQLEQLTSETRLMIMPGYTFRVIGGMITNFHQPGSSLLLLVAAFLGNDWKKVYDYALKYEFRFLSYGDACLFL